MKKIVLLMIGMSFITYSAPEIMIGQTPYPFIASIPLSDGTYVAAVQKDNEQPQLVAKDANGNYQFYSLACHQGLTREDIELEQNILTAHSMLNILKKTTFYKVAAPLNILFTVYGIYHFIRTSYTAFRSDQNKKSDR